MAHPYHTPTLDEEYGKIRLFTHSIATKYKQRKNHQVLQSTGNPIPSGLSNLDGFIHSLTDPGSPVKMRISSETESQQFGDWHNHPENAGSPANTGFLEM